jgi:hypothetical protein
MIVRHFHYNAAFISPEGSINFATGSASTVIGELDCALYDRIAVLEKVRFTFFENDLLQLLHAVLRFTRLLGLKSSPAMRKRDAMSCLSGVRFSTGVTVNDVAILKALAIGNDDVDLAKDLATLTGTVDSLQTGVDVVAATTADQSITLSDLSSTLNNQELTVKTHSNALVDLQAQLTGEDWGTVIGFGAIVSSSPCYWIPRLMA